MNQSATQTNTLQIGDAHCVLLAEVLGDGPLISKLGQKEASRAVERCRARAARSVEAYQGRTVRSEGNRLIAVFQRSDSAVLAANDIRDRINQLPPVSGVSLSVRVGVHAGAIEGVDKQDGEATINYIAKKIAESTSGQVVLSGEATRKAADSGHSEVFSQTHLSPLSESGEPHDDIGGDALIAREITLPPPQLAPRAPQAPAPSAPSATGSPSQVRRTRLMLKFMSGTFIVSDSHPVLLAGRDEGNDVVVTDRRVSRQHARVESRSGRYVLIDTSTNGTFLLDDNGVEVVLRRGECELPTRGKIGFGYSPQEANVEVCSFDISSRD